MYKVNPAVYGGMFAVPTELADRLLVRLSAPQLKIIIFLLRSSNCIVSLDEISQGTGIAKEEAADALLFWQRQGYVIKAEEAENNATLSINGKITSQSTDAYGAKPGADSANVGEKAFVTASQGASLPFSSNMSAAAFVTASQGVTSPLKANNGNVELNAAKAEANTQNDTKKEIINAKPSKLSYDVICKRIGESNEVRVLFSEVQMKLGRTIGTGDQSSLLLLHDYYGLPVEIILIICEYARAHGKSGNMSYIYTMGVDWSRREIETIEAADEELKAIEATVECWNSFCTAAKIKQCHPTSEQRGYFENWINAMHYSVELIAAAYAEMKANTARTSFKYMNSVLAAWHKDGVKTPQDAAERQKKHDYEAQKAMLDAKNKNQSQKAAARQTQNASYDINKAEQKARTTLPTLKKKEKR